MLGLMTSSDRESWRNILQLSVKREMVIVLLLLLKTAET